MSYQAINFSYLHRALHLARLADHAHFPNPQVGAVIVNNNRIIGEGYHKRAGEAHAEVEAVRSVEDKRLLSESTIYVTLEPCSFFGKTPACVDLIIKHRIPRVVVGCLDPNPKVSGKGVERLRAQGVEVVLAPDPSAFEALIKWFRVNQLEKRAWVTAKWAESADGFIGSFDSEGKPVPRAISGFETGIFTHKLRAQHQAILIGRTTAESDDPALTTRHYPGPSPLRLVLDPSAKLSPSLGIFQDPEKTRRLCHHLRQPYDWQLPKPSTWSALLEHLFQDRGICSLLVEGGSYTLQKLLTENVVDEIVQIKSSIVLGNGTKAPSAPSRMRLQKRIFLGKDEIALLNCS
jgi:diaminohydroxyphosphoribosylaminopyrimidine deaminase/5-amino-6-(5-phosphoribosylamino)uracil reductase